MGNIVLALVFCGMGIGIIAALLAEALSAERGKGGV